MLRLVAIGVAGGVMAVSLLVAALQNPYLRPRTTITSEAMAASPPISDTRPPQTRFELTPDAKMNAADKMSKTPKIQPLEDRVVANRAAPSPPMPERRERLSPADGFSARAETAPARKEDAEQKPDITPSSAYPLPPPAHLAALVRSTPVTQPEKLLPSPSLAPVLRERPSPLAKESRPSPPKGRDRKEKGQKNVQLPLPPKRTRSIRIAKTHENVRITTPDSATRDGVLSAQSRTGERYPDVRVIYGTRSSANVFDGPRIIRLK